MAAFCMKLYIARTPMYRNMLLMDRIIPSCVHQWMYTNTDHVYMPLMASACSTVPMYRTLVFHFCCVVVSLLLVGPPILGGGGGAVLDLLCLKSQLVKGLF